MAVNAHSIHSIHNSCTGLRVLYYHSQKWLRGPIQGVSHQEATRLVFPLAVETPALSPQLHGPLCAVGCSSTYGLARPIR